MSRLHRVFFELNKKNICFTIYSKTNENIGSVLIFCNTIYFDANTMLITSLFNSIMLNTIVLYWVQC